MTYPICSTIPITNSAPQSSFLFREMLQKRLECLDFSKALESDWVEGSLYFTFYTTVEGYPTVAVQVKDSTITYYKQFRSIEWVSERYFDSFSEIEYFQNTNGLWTSSARGEFEITHNSLSDLFKYIDSSKDLFSDKEAGPHLFDQPNKQAAWDRARQVERANSAKPSLLLAVFLGVLASSPTPSILSNLWSSVIDVTEKVVTNISTTFSGQSSTSVSVAAKVALITSGINASY